MIKFRILSAAARDLAYAVDYYETQSSGQGSEFLDEFERTISRICRFPDAWALVSPWMRRCLIRGFLMQYLIPGIMKRLSLPGWLIFA